MIDSRRDHNIRPPVAVDVGHCDLVGVQYGIVCDRGKCSTGSSILQQHAHCIGAADYDIDQPVTIYIRYGD